MCRLFGMSGGSKRIRATFWLVEAPDDLAAQSRREPDGTGLGTFDADGTPRVDKAPIAAYQDQQFAREAKECVSTTFIAHIRLPPPVGYDHQNTHPFQQRGRLFAHNGVIGDLPRLETELDNYRSLVAGDTDSEPDLGNCRLDVTRRSQPGWLWRCLCSSQGPVVGCYSMSTVTR